MKPSRASFTAGAAAAFATVGLLRYPAGAAEFTYKLGINKPVSHPQVVRSVKAAQSVEQATNGRLHIDIFPNNQLGNDTEMLAQVRSGAIELLQVPDGPLSNVVPLVAIVTLTFTFRNYNEVFAALDGTLGTTVRGAIAKAGLVPFDTEFCSGMKQICSSTHPIETPDDLRGFKVRVPQVALEIDAFKALGAAPTPVSFAETYVALQTRLVDGAELPIVTIETGKYYEVQKYISILNCNYTGDTMLANADAWAKLPPNVRDIVMKTFDQAAKDERNDIVATEAASTASLKAHGIVFNQPSLEPFRTVMKKSGIYGTWRDKFGPQVWAQLEQYAGALA